MLVAGSRRWKPSHIPISPLDTPQRKKRTHVPTDEDPSKKGQPKSFVFRRGRHAVRLLDLDSL